MRPAIENDVDPKDQRRLMRSDITRKIARLFERRRLPAARGVGRHDTRSTAIQTVAGCSSAAASLTTPFELQVPKTSAVCNRTRLPCAFSEFHRPPQKRVEGETKMPASEDLRCVYALGAQSQEDPPLAPSGPTSGGFIRPEGDAN